MGDKFSIEGLRYAHAVAETKSFSAAARAYGVTQPALSNGIAKLEERLGGRLFERSPRGVTKTAFGARLLPMIARAVTELDKVIAEARRLTESSERDLRMGISPLINPQLVARAFTAVRQLPTPRGLTLREANMSDLRESLIAADLDVILIPSVAPQPRFEHRIIDSEPLVVVDSSSTPHHAVELSETAESEFILVPDTCGLTTFTTQLFETHDLSLRTYAGEASSYRVLEHWAHLGLGSAIVPRSKLTSPHVQHRPLLEDGIEVEIFYEAVWHPDTAVAADIENIVDALASTMSIAASGEQVAADAPHPPAPATTVSASARPAPHTPH